MNLGHSLDRTHSPERKQSLLIDSWSTRENNLLRKEIFKEMSFIRRILSVCRSMGTIRCEGSEESHISMDPGNHRSLARMFFRTMRINGTQHGFAVRTFGDFNIERMFCTKECDDRCLLILFYFYQLKINAARDMITWFYISYERHKSPTK